MPEPEQEEVPERGKKGTELPKPKPPKGIRNSGADVDTSEHDSLGNSKKSVDEGDEGKVPVLGPRGENKPADVAGDVVRPVRGFKRDTTTDRIDSAGTKIEDEHRPAQIGPRGHSSVAYVRDTFQVDKHRS